MTTETRRRLLDALRSCHAIARYTAGLDLAAYERADIVRDAVERRQGSVRETLILTDSLATTVSCQIRPESLQCGQLTILLQSKQKSPPPSSSSSRRNSWVALRLRVSAKTLADTPSAGQHKNPIETSDV
jgi:hypothetical protein